MSKIHYKQPASREDFIELVRKLDLKPPVIIKPNWGTSACFTEAELIDWTLEAIDGEAVVVESYGWARTEESLLTGRLGSKKKGDLRKSDEWFLKYSGMDEVLEKHGVEFINISEENWAKRTVYPDEVKVQVESQFDPVMREELYGVIPERLYELRHGDLLSLSKVKLWHDIISVSFTIKNLFGMIPDPSRMKYHGKNHVDLHINIVDIYKIYHTLFNIKGVVEAMKTASRHDPDTGKTCIYEDLRFAAVSHNPVMLDAACALTVGVNPMDNRYLSRAIETFGGLGEKLKPLDADLGLTG